MALAVESPARGDLSFRTNDDKVIGARWLKSDGTTPVVLDSVTLTLAFDAPLPEYDEDGVPVPWVPEEHVIDGTTVDDPAGWADASRFASGVALVTIPHGIWADYMQRVGVWDMVAVGEGLQRCLVRGRFVAEEGVST